jgi:hypothetical protein
MRHTHQQQNHHIPAGYMLFCLSIIAAALVRQRSSYACPLLLAGQAAVDVSNTKCEVFSMPVH